MKKFTVNFSEVDKNDISLVGGKGANLGEMVKAGFPVPPGFIVTAQAYQYFIKANNLNDNIKKQLSLLDANDPQSLDRVSKNIKNLINRSPIPKILVKNIFKAYEKLDGKLKNPLVAVRSSATAEDLLDASFAGQQETFLNVKGEAVLAEKIRDAWSSLFTPRAIFYRQEKGFDHFKVYIAIPVQKMIQSDVSGIMFTINPTNNDKKIILIEAIYGLGELVVQGTVTPDNYEVDKQTLEIKNKKIEKQQVYLTKVGTSTKQKKVRKSRQRLQKLSNEQIIKLAEMGKRLHQHYFFPQDIEWAVEKGKIYILQTRPVTTIRKVASRQFPATSKSSLPLIVKGQGASPGLVSGKAQIIHSSKEIDKIDDGEILVTSMTSPDFVPAMRKAVAIVTDKGGQTSHAAIVSRELGVPCVVGTHEATKKIKTGDLITVNGRTGEVFKGQLDLRGKSLRPQFQKGRSLESFKNRPFSAKKLKTATKIYVNLAEPHLVKKIAKQNVDGVGLLRAEFMIAQIGTHPKKLIQQGKQNEFVSELGSGMEKFCKAFNPRPIVYRTTDFKTNEYRNLVGGKEFEPEEENPMLGFRGVYRYIVQPEVFELEIEAIKKIRNKGYRNLHLMLPFVRTVNELWRVKKFIAACGLIRSPSFKIWIMIEVPSNVVILKDFIKLGIDGISIGTNDLTMLTLGVDRDNENISPEFDEKDPAVLWMLKKAIKTAQKYKITSSICGQAPSLYPDLTEKLVRWGITSISVSPDMIEKTREIVYEAEKRLIKNKR